MTSPTVEHDGAAADPTDEDLEVIDDVSPPGTARRWPEPLTLLALAVGLIVIGALHVSLSGDLRSPIIHADEAGYMGQARYLADGYGRANAGYYAGYSILITPAAMLADAPVRFFRLIVLTNIGLVLLSAVFAYALIRVLHPKAPRWVPVTTIVVMALYPLTFSFAGLAMSENGLVPATLAAALAVAHAARTRSWVWFAVAGLVTSLSYWITPRGVLVAGAFVVALGIEWYRTRLSWRTVVFGMAGIGGGLVAGHLFNRWAKGNGYIAGVSGRRNGPVDIVTGVDGWNDWLAGILGRVAYLGAASAGLFLVGAVAAALWGRMRGADPLSSARRAAGVFALLTVAFTMIGDAASQSQRDVLRRLDFLYYGRYTEGVAMPLLAIGIAWLLTQRSRKALIAMAVGVPAAIVGALGLAFVLEPKRPPEVTTNLVNVLSVLPIKYWFDPKTVATAIVVGAGIALVVLLARVVHQAVGVVALVLVFAAGGLVTHDQFVEKGAASRADQRAIADLVLRLEANGVPTDCILLADRRAEFSYWHVYNYRAFLPHSEIIRDNNARADECGPLVLSGNYENAFALDGAYFAGAENHTAIGLWLDPTRVDANVLDTVIDGGMIFPSDPCAALPPETYDAQIAASVLETHADAIELSLDVFHGGGGAPWLGSNTLVTPAGCGRVAATVDLLDANGDVLYSHRGTIPRTTLPGEHAAFKTTVRPEGVDLADVASLRVAMVQDGVTWFRDKGAADVILARGTDW